MKHKRIVYQEGGYKVYNFGGDDGYWAIKLKRSLICVCHKEYNAFGICHALAVMEQINS